MLFKAKLTFLWYDKKTTSLESNGMAAIPKTSWAWAKAQTSLSLNEPVT